MQMIALVLTSILARFRSERGQDLIEYALLSGIVAAALIAVVVAGGLTGAVGTMVGSIADCIDFVAGTPCTGPFG